MTDPVVKVLCIVGKGRSGTTLLDNMVGQLPGFHSMGEFAHLFEWGLVNGFACGCGEPVPQCDLWSSVLADAFPGGAPDPRVVVAWKEQIFTWRNVPGLLTNHPPRAIRGALRSYCAVQAAVIRSVAKVTGARVVVDSTKMPVAATALGLVPGTSVRYVHIVRDPRAVVHSWRRRKKMLDRSGDEMMPLRGAAHTMASYWGHNVVAEILARRSSPRRHVRLRYEDLVTAPAAALTAIARLMEEPTSDLPVIDEREVMLRPTHTAGGNPDRMRTGVTRLRDDDEWVTHQGRRDRFVATLYGLPFLLRYGYRVIPRR